MDRTTTWAGRAGTAIGGVLLATAALVAPVAARESVDPSTLNPPPAEFKNPVCAWSGQQVVCTMDYQRTVRDEPTGIQCEGGELIESSDRHNIERRVFDANLDVVQNRAFEWIEGTLFVRETGTSVRWTGTDGGVAIYSVPGDRSSGVTTNEGAGIHLYLNDGRSISLAGRTVENLDTGEFSIVGAASKGFDLCDALQ